MDWRSKSILLDFKYIENIKNKHLDIVLSENPDPIGMAVRIFRQISKKQAETITPKVVDYLSNFTKNFSYNMLTDRERLSYGNNCIESIDYRFFKEYNFQFTRENIQFESFKFNELRNAYVEKSFSF